MKFLTCVTLLFIYINLCLPWKSYGAEAEPEHNLLRHTAVITDHRSDRVVVEFLPQNEIHIRYNIIVSNPTIERIEEIHTRAAEGDRVAQTVLAKAFEEGIGLRRNMAKAIEWYTLAANQGEPEAQYKLGEITFEKLYRIGGLIIWGDPMVPIEWFERAANQGHKEAQARLGYEYYYGESIPRNWERGRYWFRRAAEQGHLNSQEHLYYEHIDETEREHREREYPDYKQEAARWALVVAERGRSDAQYRYAEYCADGYGVPVNFAEAVRWYERSIESNDSRSAFALAKILEEGRPGVSSNIARAADLYRLAGNLGLCKKAYYRAGILYEEREEIRNQERAFEFYDLATDFRSFGSIFHGPVPEEVLDAYYRLGRMYEEGRGTTQDDYAAVYCYKSAANKGHMLASEKLDRLYAQNRGLSILDRIVRVLV